MTIKKQAVEMGVESTSSQRPSASSPDFYSTSDTKRYPRFSTVSNVRIAAISSSDLTQTQGARLGLTSMIRNESLPSSYTPR